ncbi:MAG TPA: hypothetical protein VJB82_04360 [Candidatus Peribacterales bacterium]|nr:hypothetical protein [Candidatus Peribacterales bacterium]
MDLKEFFQQARQIGLSDEEKSSIRFNLATRKKEWVRSNASVRQQGDMGQEILQRLAHEKRHVSLSHEEWINIRKHLKASLREERVHMKEGAEELNDGDISSFWNSISLWGKMRLLPITALLLFFASGVAMAADYAAPGALLYPVKILVTENVIGAVQLTDEAKTRWDVERTERRLHEAVALAATEEFIPEKTAALHEAFLAQMQRVRSRIEVLASSGQQDLALEVLSAFEAILQAHSAVLSDLAQIDTEFGNVLEGFIEEMNVETAIIASTREKIEQETLGNAHVERAILSAGIQMQENLDYVESKTDQGIEEHVDAKAKAAQAVLHDAKAKFMEGADREALSLIRNGLKASEEAALLQEVQEVRQTYGRSRTLTPWQLDWKPESRRSLQDQTETTLERQKILREEGR